MKEKLPLSFFTYSLFNLLSSGPLLLCFTLVDFSPSFVLSVAVNLPDL